MNVPPEIGKGTADDMLGEAISDEEMDRLLADEDHDEIGALLQEAYDEVARGECAPLEPIPVLLAQMRARFRPNGG
jgi:hypothetical protein